jgi:hypothetical protein
LAQAGAEKAKVIPVKNNTAKNLWLEKMLKGFIFPAPPFDPGHDDTKCIRSFVSQPPHPGLSPNLGERGRE